MFACLLWVSLWLAIVFIKYFEWEAVNRWNPFGTYTPSINNPRCGYQVVFERGFQLGFDLQTMFRNLHFRDSFN